jgi:hypothetical protein
MRNTNRRNIQAAMGSSLIIVAVTAVTAVLQVTMVLNTAMGQLPQQTMNSTVNITQLRAEDPMFANFVAVSDECLNSLDPNYNNTTTTTITTSPSPALCLDTMGEALRTWCGIEAYHEEKCRYVSLVNQVYQITAMGMMIR